MSSLAQLQRSLQESVLRNDPRHAADAAAVVPSHAATSAERMGVYIHAYRARLIEVLRNDFGGLLALAGQTKFDDLARAYVEAHPSREYNVRWYGAGLADFLLMAPPWHEDPALGEMARLDWTIGLAFDAPDEARVTDGAVAAVPPALWPTMRFALSRCVHRLRFECNVGAIRQSIDRGEPLPAASRLAEPQAWVVSRFDATVYHRAIDADEADALEIAAGGGTFADICEALCRWYAFDAVAQRAVALLKQWVANGWIAALRPDAGAVAGQEELILGPQSA